MLRVSELSRHYEKDGSLIKAVDGVSLSVDQGEFVVVRGPSGSGKTTLLLMAGGLLPPGSGYVRYDGTDIYSLGREQRAGLRAASVGFVFQQFNLIPYLSVLDNVLAPSLAKPDPQAAERAANLLEMFNLRHRSRHFPAELSTGERQRVGLARAMLNRPRLLLADEPTGNLDDENAREVLKRLADFTGEGGAVLMVTHNREAAEYGHRSVQLREGRIETGSGNEG
ncbi:MAG: ABC transporter ATP-binding protein [Candidatus Glassbacteria bacterium]|nr:ABC transporter ATP-binding protein [Candidatus Glassbacteria bacterium]